MGLVLGGFKYVFLFPTECFFSPTCLQSRGALVQSQLLLFPILSLLMSSLFLLVRLVRPPYIHIFHGTASTGLIAIDDSTFLMRWPSGNQTWQWKIPYKWIVLSINGIFRYFINLCRLKSLNNGKIIYKMGMFKYHVLQQVDEWNIPN